MLRVQDVLSSSHCYRNMDLKQRQAVVEDADKLPVPWAYLEVPRFNFRSDAFQAAMGTGAISKDSLKSKSFNRGPTYQTAAESILWQV